MALDEDKLAGSDAASRLKEGAKPPFKAGTTRQPLLLSPKTLVSLRFPATEKRIMAKGQMKSNKEARKPKKDAKKPVAAPALKAAPVPAAKIKDKK